MFKKNIVFRFKYALLLFIGVVLVFSSCSQQDIGTSTKTTYVHSVLAEDFAPGQLEAHYLKHKYEFGDITQNEYLDGARVLLNSAPERDTLEKIRANGDILHYRVSTGEFAVMARDGRIRTYFKTNYKYWLKQ